MRARAHASYRGTFARQLKCFVVTPLRKVICASLLREARYAPTNYALSLLSFPYIHFENPAHSLDRAHIVHQGTIRKITAIANGSFYGRGFRNGSVFRPLPSSFHPLSRCNRRRPRLAACKGATNRTKEPRAII